MLSHVGGEDIQPGGGVVAQVAGKGLLWPVDQLVPVTVRLVFEAPVAGGAEVEELPDTLTSLQPGRGEYLCQLLGQEGAEGIM